MVTVVQVEPGGFLNLHGACGGRIWCRWPCAGGFLAAHHGGLTYGRRVVAVVYGGAGSVEAAGRGRWLAAARQ